MAGYEELSDIMGQMKRAAIDCWMADQSFYPSWGNDQIYAKWGWMLNFYNRPDANGNGGGDGNGVNDSCAAQFDEIRAAIDQRVSQWLGLPDGSLCVAPQQAASSSAAIFGASGTGASVQNNGEIVTSNQTVSEGLINKIEGRFKAPFLDKYYSQFSNIQYGLGAACAILEANYSAENKMWPAARADVTKICEDARNAWAATAEQEAAASGTLTLTVVGAVAGAVATVATAGTAAPAVAALVGLSTVATGAVAGIAATTAVSGGSYLDILSSLDEALNDLNDALYKQEDALNTMMSDAVSTIRGDLASFDLDAFSLGTYAGDDGSISMQQENADIISNSMTRIDGALGSASTALGSSPESSPTPRDYRIGYSADGTHWTASELYALTARCLTLTISEYGRGQKLFEATVADYFNTDAHAKQQVASLIADEALTTDVGV